MTALETHAADLDARSLLFADARWFAELSEGNAETWGAWRITKSGEDAWWKHILHIAALFAAEHNLLSEYRSRFAGIPLAELTLARAERDGRRSTDPIWDIANELIVASYFERVLAWRLVEHEPLARGARRGDWQFSTQSGREVFIEVKSLHESERLPSGVYSRPTCTGRIRSVLRDAYRQLPCGDRATLVVLVGWRDLLGIPFGIMYGDIFQSLFGRVQVTFQVMPYDPESVRVGPSFRDMFVQGSKHRRLGLVAGMVVSGMDKPGIQFYAIHNPFAYHGCRVAGTDVEPASQFVLDEQGHWEVRDGISPGEVWHRMSGKASAASKRGADAAEAAQDSSAGQVQ